MMSDDTRLQPTPTLASRSGSACSREFAGPDELIALPSRRPTPATRQVEAYSPFAILGIDEALKAKGTILPWIVFVHGPVTGRRSAASACSST